MTVYAPPGSADSLVSVQSRYGHFIGGNWVEPKKGDYFEKVRQSPLFQASKNRYSPGWGVNDLLADPKFVSAADSAKEPFDVRLQLAALRYVTTSEAAARSLAENYVGLVRV